MRGVLIFALLVVIICAKKSKPTKSPKAQTTVDVKESQTTKPSSPPKDSGSGSGPWVPRRRRPRMMYSDYDYYNDFYGMGRNCHCTPFRCRRRSAFRGRCNNGGYYRRPGVLCCYSFRNFYDDFEFEYD